ncbi:MAG: SDR family oxidoreductase [Alphaproteobacteria bacterium]|nr:SDR family oxidoreductase [Alphaproteobacteria bacterium]
MRIPGKVFLVTGGGNGIGREVVLALLAQGARVAAVDLSAAGLEATAKLAGDVGERLSSHVVDVTDRAAVDALPAAVIAAHGALDGCLLVAGIIQPFVPIADLDEAAIDRVMAVNFHGPLHLTKVLLPHLLQRPEAHLVAISSMGGFVPVPGQTAYGASKAALKLLFEGLHSELTDTPVRVSIVFPGAVGTDIAVNSKAMSAADMEKASAGSNFPMLTPAEAARQILRGMERDRYHVLVGKDARLMDALVRIAPERAARMIWKQMQGLLKG